jgi:hypothetical protein
VVLLHFRQYLSTSGGPLLAWIIHVTTADITAAPVANPIHSGVLILAPYVLFSPQGDYRPPGRCGLQQIGALRGRGDGNLAVLDLYIHPLLWGYLQHCCGVASR